MHPSYLHASASQWCPAGIYMPHRWPHRRAYCLPKAMPQLRRSICLSFPVPAPLITRVTAPSSRKCNTLILPTQEAHARCFSCAGSIMDILLDRAPIVPNVHYLHTNKTRSSLLSPMCSTTLLSDPRSDFSHEHLWNRFSLLCTLPPCSLALPDFSHEYTGMS